MKLLTADAHVLGGADAVVHIAKHVWWLRPLAWLAAAPIGMRLLNRAYRLVAANRYCMAGTCRTQGGN